MCWRLFVFAVGYLLWCDSGVVRSYLGERSLHLLGPGWVLWTQSKFWLATGFSDIYAVIGVVVPSIGGMVVLAAWSGLQWLSFGSHDASHSRTRWGGLFLPPLLATAFHVLRYVYA